MRRRPLKKRIAPLPKEINQWDYPELPNLSTSYARLFGAYLRITTSFAGCPCGPPWLACLIHAASVHPELGSNSTYKTTGTLSTALAIAGSCRFLRLNEAGENLNPSRFFRLHTDLFLNNRFGSFRIFLAATCWKILNITMAMFALFQLRLAQKYAKCTRKLI